MRFLGYFLRAVSCSGVIVCVHQEKGRALLGLLLWAKPCS